jgi:hypothetical protein
MFLVFLHLFGAGVDKCGQLGSLPSVTFVLYAGEGAKPARLTLQVQRREYGEVFFVSNKGWQ